VRGWWSRGVDSGGSQGVFREQLGVIFYIKLCNRVYYLRMLTKVSESKYNGQKLRRRSEVQTKCGALHELLKENATNCQH
jgi:hypothetical protein